MDDYNHLSENDQMFIKEFSTFVNGKMSSAKKVGKELTKDHRYLVNEKFKIMLSFMETLANNWHKGHYDGRNEYACKLAATAIDNLVENDLYFVSEDYHSNNIQ